MGGWKGRTQRLGGLRGNTELVCCVLLSRCASKTQMRKKQGDAAGNHGHCQRERGQWITSFNHMAQTHL